MDATESLIDYEHLRLAIVSTVLVYYLVYSHTQLQDATLQSLETLKLDSKFLQMDSHLIGCGGFGDVYSATLYMESSDTTLAVAVKKLKPHKDLSKRARVLAVSSPTLLPSSGLFINSVLQGLCT